MRSLCEPLLHAEREVLCLLLACVFKPDKPEQFRDAVKGRQTDDAVLFFQVILGCHVLIDRWSLYYRAHSTAASADAGIVVFSSVDGIASGGRLLKSADKADKCSLSSAVLSHKSVDGSLGNMDGEVIQRFKVLIAFTQ